MIKDFGSMRNVTDQLSRTSGVPIMSVNEDQGYQKGEKCH